MPTQLHVPHRFTVGLHPLSALCLSLVQLHMIRLRCRQTAALAPVGDAAAADICMGAQAPYCGPGYRGPCAAGAGIGRRRA